MSTSGTEPGKTPTNKKKTNLLIGLALLAAAALALVLVFRPGADDAESVQPQPSQLATPVVDPSAGTTPANRVAAVDPNAPTGQPGAAGGPARPSEAAAAAEAGQPGDPLPGMEPASAERAPGQLAGHDIDTSGAIRLSDPMKVKISRQNAQLLRHYELEKTTMRVELCNDERGVASSTKVLASSGAEPVDADVVKQLKAWRYLPSLVNGQPAASCTAVDVQFQIED